MLAAPGARVNSRTPEGARGLAARCGLVESSTMTATLLVPGTPVSVDAWARVLAEHGLGFDGKQLEGSDIVERAELVPNDGHFADAFRLPTVSDAQRRAIGTAGSALLLTVTPPLQHVAAAIAVVATKLQACGGLAIRIEESALGYPIGEWVRLVGSGDPWALYRAAIVVLSDNGGAMQSCGMHVFGLSDAAVVAERGEANELLGAFNVFQIVDDPVLRSGETFAPDSSTPRRVLERAPDTRYPSSHACHNPFGVWQLGPPGGVARRLGDKEFVFTPSLAALLMALEQKRGTPLTRAEVEAIRDKAACIAMSPRDARALERSRGYADIDPEHAYEHWQMLRTSRP
jgi:hypothetical protein